jgi:hypothetical protein
MKPSLAAFFAEMRPFLAGQREATQVLGALGPSPSGEARFALYATLVARQRRGLLDQLYPAVRQHAELLRPGLWAELCAAYERQHLPTHWEPNRFGEAFSTFLAERREATAADPDATPLPSYLEEMADFLWLRYQCGVALSGTDAADTGFDRSLFVRSYEHDVLSLVRAKEPRLPEGPPSPTPFPVLVCWSHTTARVFVTRPSLAVLFTLGRRLGHLPASAPRPPALTDALLGEAQEQLESWGVLRPRDADEGPATR